MHICIFVEHESNTLFNVSRVEITDINTPSMKHNAIGTYDSYRASDPRGEDSYIKHKKTKTYTISTITCMLYEVSGSSTQRRLSSTEDRSTRPSAV